MPLLAVLRMSVDPLDSQRICKDLQGIHEIDAVLDEVGFPLRLIPLEHWFLVYGVPVPRSRRVLADRLIRDQNAVHSQICIPSARPA